VSRDTCLTKISHRSSLSIGTKQCGGHSLQDLNQEAQGWLVHSSWGIPYLIFDLRSSTSHFQQQGTKRRVETSFHVQTTLQKLVNLVRKLRRRWRAWDPLNFCGLLHMYLPRHVPCFHFYQFMLYISHLLCMTFIP
jgi:hypothetical protein